MSHRTTTITTLEQEESADVGSSSIERSQDARNETTPSAPHVLTVRSQPRVEATQSRDSVRWSDDVVDNENMGKKKSKKCCIYHKPRTFGEWSDSEDSDHECHHCDH